MPSSGPSRSVSAASLALGPDPQDLAHDLRQRHETAEAGRAVRPRAVRPVRKLLDPVQHADRERLAADRAPALAAPALRRLQADVALAVAVQMVLAFLGEELDGAAVALAGLQRPPHGEVVDVGREHARLPPQHRRRVRVRVAHQPVAVQRRHPPVHGGVRGEPGLQREDVPGQVGVAVVDRVKARLGAEHGEPGGPHVGRHQVGAGAALKGDLQQVARVEAEDRPPVRGDVADAPEPAVEAPGRIEVRHIDEVVDLAGALAALVDGGDLHREHEAHRPAARRRQGPPDLAVEVATQAEQTRLGRLQTATKLLEPRRVRKVPGAHHGNALPPRPPGEVLEVAVPAARARVL